MSPKSNGRSGRVGRVGPVGREPGALGRFRRSRPGAALLLALLAVMVVGVPLVSAAVVLSDDETTIAADQRFAEDAYLFGDEVTFDGQSTRDVIAATSTFRFGESARIEGNLNVAAQDVRLNGTVDRSVRVAAREIIVSGTILGDLVVAAQTVTIQADARIGGDVILAAADATVQGQVGGEIRGNVGDLTLNNVQVGQGVAVGVEQLDLRGTTTINGPVRYASDSDLTRSGQVTIAGEVVRDAGSGVSAGDYSIGGGIAWSLIKLVTILVTGLVVVLVAPSAAASLAEGVRRRFPTTLVAGIAGIILVPIVAVILAVTVIGIPVSLVSLILFGVALYLSQVFVGLALGRAILPRSWRSIGRGYNLLAMVLGVAIIGAIRLIPLPFVDLTVAVVVAVLGIGALFTASRDLPPTGPPAPASPYGDGVWAGAGPYQRP